VNSINVALITYRDAPESIIMEGQHKLAQHFPDVMFQFNQPDPDVIFCLTGGSESYAVQWIHDAPLILLAQTAGNSFAAATETLAYCRQNGVKAILFNLDTDPSAPGKVLNLAHCFRAIRNMKGQRVGLLGQPSQWLVASKMLPQTLKTKLGMDLISIPWDQTRDYMSFSKNEAYLNHFEDDSADLQKSSRVYSMLQDIIETQRLNAITVECFPMVKETGVTACLALSKLNADGLPGGCEGDLPSLVGKILVKELTNQVPWMANLAALANEQALFAHCTIGTHLVSDYEITTHYETGQGTALQATFSATQATILRLDSALEKAFLAKGDVLERPRRPDACRTQIAIGLRNDDFQLLQTNPLGNHHLILPGDHLAKLKTCLDVLDIQILNTLAV